MNPQSVRHYFQVKILLLSIMKVKCGALDVFACQMQVVGKKGESHWRGKDDTTYCCNLSTGVSLRQHDWAKSTHTHSHTHSGALHTSLSSPSEGERAREDTALSQWGRVSRIIFIWKPPENVPVNKVDPFSKACGYCLSVLTLQSWNCCLFIILNTLI